MLITRNAVFSELELIFKDPMATAAPSIPWSITRVILEFN